MVRTVYVIFVIGKKIVAFSDISYIFGLIVVLLSVSFFYYFVMIVVFLKLGALVLCAILAGYCLKQAVRALLNLRALNYEKKHPGFLPRSGAGIVYNKKTGKLEETPGKPILPY